MIAELYILAAFILDSILGDPVYPLHPIRLVGILIAKGENLFRRITPWQFLNGLAMALFIILFTWGFATLLLRGATYIDSLYGVPLLYSLFSLYLLYSCLALHDLCKESRKIYTLLEDGSLDRARQALSMIVGRDTATLSEKEIVRAAVETVSENFVDGILSPLIYAAIGGAPLALAYKAINTLDSMVGYKNERYILFGRPSARIDDAANFIPARLSPLFIAAGGLLLNITSDRSISPIRALTIAIRDGQKNPSPNSGISEAATAGALGIELGGTNYYQGKTSHKQIIGDRRKELSREDILRANRLVILASISALFFVLVLSIIAREFLIPKIFF